MKTPFEIVVISSNLQHRLQLARILIGLGLDPICRSTLRECNATLFQNNVGLVFCDARITDSDYNDLLKNCPDRKPSIVLTSHSGDDQEISNAMRHRAFYVIAAPYRPREVEWMVIQAKRLAHREVQSSLRYS